jgi:hypothetical protein
MPSVQILKKKNKVGTGLGIWELIKSISWSTSIIEYNKKKSLDYKKGECCDCLKTQLI